MEVCRRAGVTRGAFNHHYLRLSDLFAEVLDEVYARFAPAGDENDDERGSERGAAARDTLEYRLERGLEVYTMPEFKAILELWLACRNARQLGKALFARIAVFAERFSPTAYPPLQRKLASSPAGDAGYWLIFETLIGLALGRATSPMGEAPAHEAMVVNQLRIMAREHDARMNAQGEQ